MGLERGTRFPARETAPEPSLIGRETRIVDSESRGGRRSYRFAAIPPGSERAAGSSPGRPAI